MTIAEKLKQLGYSTVSDGFYDKISEWNSWYVGDVKKFTWYKVRTGEKSVRCKRSSLGMAKKTCEDWANLLLNEKVHITLEGEAEQEFVDSVLNDSNFPVKGNEMQEVKAALGTVAYIPRVVGQKEAGVAEGIKLDYVTAESIRPLSWQNGVVDECAFCCEKSIGGKNYVYIQIHKRTANGEYEIQNHLCESKNGNLSDVPLNSVKGFENVPASVSTKSNKRQFVIDRLNIANNVDPAVPLGVSVYANAIDVLKGVDIAYDSYVNEFVLGKKRIMVKPAATNYLGGEAVFDEDELVFYVLPEDTTGEDVIVPIDMTLRTAEHNRGIQDQLNLLSAKCGFGENHYKFDGGSVATATQVVSENSALFRTLKKHEIILESALIELCRILLRLGNSALGMSLDEDVEISIDFDDSIIEDEESKFNRDARLLQMGIMNDWEFRMKWMNEDEATARKMLPGMESMTTEGQSEVE